nr:phosphotransferase [Paenibacillus sacheonensis]
MIALNGFQNVVYSGLAGGREVILRMAHVSHRNEALTKAELAFVLYLAESGVRVARPVPSMAGELVHTIDEAFVVTAFEKLPGRQARIAEESDVFYTNIGRMVGKIHKHSRCYAPRERRNEWHDNALLASFKTHCPPELYDGFDRLMAEVGNLPKDRDDFGLIHGDVSCGNYLHDGDEAHIIDFDEAEYSWYVSDIAVPLFYEIPIPWVVDGTRRVEITKRFYSNFMNGYCKENAISEAWLKKIPLFIDLRQARVLSALYRSRDFNAPDWSEWDEQARRFFYSNLLHDTPYIDVDFSHI